MLDGFALVLEVSGAEVTSRRMPPPPVLPAMPVDRKRLAAYQDAKKAADAIDTTAEVVS